MTSSVSRISIKFAYLLSHYSNRENYIIVLGALDDLEERIANQCFVFNNLMWATTYPFSVRHSGRRRILRDIGRWQSTCSSTGFNSHILAEQFYSTQIVSCFVVNPKRVSNPSFRTKCRWMRRTHLSLPSFPPQSSSSLHSQNSGLLQPSCAVTLIPSTRCPWHFDWYYCYLYLFLRFF